MSASVADVFRTVEYSRDKWTMERVPLALLFCLVGIAFAVYVAPRPPGRAILVAFIVLVAMAVIFVVGGILFEQIFEGRTPFIRFLAAGLAIVVMMIVPWRFSGPLYGRGPKVPPDIFGWMLIVGAIGWIAFALYRHFKPATPILTLSPAGISYHASVLRNLFIPWHEVQGVDALEQTRASGYSLRYPDFTAVLLSREFYERHILVKRSVLGGPRRSWDAMFLPKGSSMQMVLHHKLFSIDPKHIREPVEARWEAFRCEPPSPPPDAGPTAEARQVYGAWSIDGSLWQATTFLMPLLGIVAMLAASTSVWQR